MEPPAVGLVGAGVIGTRFIQKIVAAGWPLTVYDIDADKQRAATALGAEPARCAREVTERSEVVLLALPGSHAVEAAMEGPGGVLAGLRPGHLVMDTGTSRPSTDVHYAERVRERGARMVDAPLTGRERGMIFMVGGDVEDFQRAEPILNLLGCKVAHCGPIGYGQCMKLVNQFILAARLAVYAEAAHLARALDLDPEAIESVLEFGEARGALQPQIRAPGAQYLALHTKDLEYLSEITAAEGIYAPLTELATRIFRETRTRGEPDWTQAAIVTHWPAQSAPRAPADGTSTS